MNKIIALDFDGTLVTHKYPHLGSPILKNIEKIKQEIQGGAKVILWTCRTGKALKEAVSFCEQYDIKLDAVNENLPEMIGYFGGDSRKILANEYWDDKAVCIGE